MPAALASMLKPDYDCRRNKSRIVISRRAERLFVMAAALPHSRRHAERASPGRALSPLLAQESTTALSIYFLVSHLLSLPLATMLPADDAPCLRATHHAVRQMVVLMLLRCRSTPLVKSVMAAID